MKTITEFLGATLKNALKTKQELVAAGKTAEELPAAMGESLKLEGDKLTVLLSTLEIVEKKTNDLKRVVVCTLAEGEVAPKGLEKKGDHYFSVEFFPPMPGQEPARGKGRGDARDGGKDRGRAGKRDGKRGGRGGQDRDGRGGGRDGGGGGRRPPRDGAQAAPHDGAPRRAAPIVINPPTEGGANASANPSEGSQDQKRNARNRPRRPKKPREPEAPHVTPPPSANPTFVIQPRSTPLPPAAAAAPATETSSSTESNS